MMLEDLLREENEKSYSKGLTEGISKGLAETLLLLISDKWKIPESLAKKIRGEKDKETLNKWIVLAANTKELNEFIEKIS